MQLAIELHGWRTRLIGGCEDGGKASNGCAPQSIEGDGFQAAIRRVATHTEACNDAERALATRVAKG